jgi:ATP-dependent Lhr-like helicase
VTLFDLIDAVAPLPEPFARWFASRGWAPRAHQLELLAKARAGRSVLLIAPTGAGKTLAGFLPSLVELSSQSTRHVQSPPSLSHPRKGGGNDVVLFVGLAALHSRDAQDVYATPTAQAQRWRCAHRCDIFALQYKN